MSWSCPKSSSVAARSLWAAVRGSGAGDGVVAVVVAQYVALAEEGGGEVVGVRVVRDPALHVHAVLAGGDALLVLVEGDGLDVGVEEAAVVELLGDRLEFLVGGGAVAGRC
jgi:hypothetical protein